MTPSITLAILCGCIALISMLLGIVVGMKLSVSIVNQMMKDKALHQLDGGPCWIKAQAQAGTTK